MRRSLILLIVCLVTLVAGCGNEESSSKGSAKKPANMCEAVAPAVPADWKLTKKSAPQQNKAKTDCTLADESGRTTLVVSVVKPKSGSSVDDAFKQLCDTYIGSPPEGEECTKDGPVELEGSPAELQQGVRLDGSEGVLWVTFRTNDPDKAAEADDVLDEVKDAVSS